MGRVDRGSPNMCTPPPLAARVDDGGRVSRVPPDTPANVCAHGSITPSRRRRNCMIASAWKIRQRCLELPYHYCCCCAACSFLEGLLPFVTRGFEVALLLLRTGDPIVHTISLPLDGTASSHIICHTMMVVFCLLSFCLFVFVFSTPGYMICIPG